MFKGHGGAWYKLKQDKEILDFSSNVNPLGPPVGIWPLIRSKLDTLKRLPELDAFSLRRSLANKFGIKEDNILVASGTSEFIYLFPFIFRSSCVYMPIPTYADYQSSSISAGLRVYPLGRWKIFPEDEDYFPKVIKDIKPNSLIYICNPNNPTGEFIPPKLLISLISSVKNSIWIIDESYIEFIGDDQICSLISDNMPSNLIVLRSFSKIYGLPGLRLGVLVAEKRLAEKVESFLRPWAVSSIAIEAGKELLTYEFYIKSVREFCQNQKEFLLKSLDFHPFLNPIAKDAHFFLIQVKAPWSVKWLCEKLYSFNVLVRDCSNFIGLSNEFIRISPGNIEENKRLVQILFSLIDSKP